MISGCLDSIAGEIIMKHELAGGHKHVLSVKLACTLGKRSYHLIILVHALAEYQTT